jgi:hypothetical protein
VTREEEREFLVNVSASLVKQLLSYLSLIAWLTGEVGIPAPYVESALNDARREIDAQTEIDAKVLAAVESAVQSSEADYHVILASFLAQWKPSRKPN